MPKIFKNITKIPNSRVQLLYCGFFVVLFLLTEQLFAVTFCKVKKIRSKIFFNFNKNVVQAVFQSNT